MSRAMEGVTMTLSGVVLPATMAAALLLVPIAPAAAVTPGVGSPGAAPVTAANMLAAYLGAHPEARTNPAFARDWAVVTDCAAWQTIRFNEFKAPAFLRAATADLASRRDPVPDTFEVRLDRNIGPYDAARGEFGLRTLGADDVLPVRMPGFLGEGAPGSMVKPGCEPSGGTFPLEFQIGFTNWQLANGLPMAPAAAEAFAAARTDRSGQRDTGVSALITVRLTLGTPRPARNTPMLSGLVVPATAQILDVAVQDRTPRHGTIYALAEDKRGAGNEEAAAVQEEARREALATPVTAANLRAQFDLERAGATVGPQPFRLAVDRQWLPREGRPGRSFQLVPGDIFSAGGDVSLRFDNVAEVVDLSPSPDLAKAFEGRVNYGSSVVYVPVGAYDDPLKGGKVVVGHVLSIDTADGTGGRRRLVVHRTTSPAKPWQPTVDARLAADFDVLGIRVGMTPEQVTRLAQAELGQALSFDATRGEVRSPPAECDFDARTGRPAPLGRRCLVGTFLRAGADRPWSLARLRLTQVVPADSLAKANEALAAKYGLAEIVRPYEGRPTLANLEGTEPTQGAVAGWGARLVERRPEQDFVPFPLHPLEMISQTSQGRTTLTTTVTDWAAISAAAEVGAAATRRAEEGIKPKF